MSMTLNMTQTQQRQMAFIISDYLQMNLQPLAAESQNSEPFLRIMDSDVINGYVSEYSTRSFKTEKKQLSDEEIAKREEIKEQKKLERQRIRDENKAKKKAEKDADKAEKKASKVGTGFTTKEMTNADGNIMKGINGASLRIAKSKNSERGVWEQNQVVMKVLENWSDTDKAEFRKRYGEPLDVKTSPKSIPSEPVTPNMAEILIEAAKPAETQKPKEIIDKASKKKARKEAALKKKAEIAKKAEAKKAEAAEAKAAEAKAAEAAEAKAAAKAAEAKKVVEAEKKTWGESTFGGETKSGESKFGGETKSGETKSSDELEFSEAEDDDTPQEWSHESYTGDKPIFKDEDNGIYHFDEENDDYEIIGFYYDEQCGDIPADTLMLD